MHDPRISVIVPTYNGATFLAETLRSLLAQTCDECEIVVVDDGSSDATTSIVRAYESQGIRLVEHEVNRGVSAAVNSGFEATTGAFVAFIGHDDLWHPEKLERQLRVFDTEPSIDACFCDFEEFGVDVPSGRFGFDQRDQAMRRYPRREIARETFVISSESFLADLARIQATILPSTLLIRRDALAKAMPLDEDVTIEDVQINFRLANQVRFAYIDRPLALRRIHKANWSSAMGDLRWLDAHIKTLQRLPRWTSLSPAESAWVDTLLAGHCAAAGYTMFSSGDLMQARAHYWNSVRAKFSALNALYLAASYLPASVISTVREFKQRFR